MEKKKKNNIVIPRIDTEKTCQLHIDVVYIYVPYFWVYSTWCVERHRKAVKGFLVRYECVCVKCVNRLTAFSGKDDFDPTLVNSEEI